MLSVVIPTLNEAATLPRTVDVLRRVAAGGFELVVSDCDSGDGTCGVAAGLGARVVTGGEHRAGAMNRGAAVARGRTLLFLHADTRLPRGFDVKIERALAGGVVGGCFEFSFGSHPGRRGLDRQLLRLVMLANRARFRHGGRSYGDQGLFMRHATFDHLGGFPHVPLMEDGRFARRLWRLGPTAVLHPPARTSPRRFVERGVLRTALLDLLLLNCDDLGIEPKMLWRYYNRFNREACAGG